MNNLLEEYKLNVDRIQALDKNIWQSATIFGIGSLVGIFAVFGYGELLKSYSISAIIIGFIGITFNLVWWRLSRRWWSIQRAIIKRMEFIENNLDLGANTYIAYLDQINCDLKPKDFNERIITNEVKNELSDLTNYECSGIQSVLKFLISTISISWFLILIILYYESIKSLRPDIILGFVLFIGLFLWFFFEIWNRP